MKITKSPQAAVQDDETVPCPACPNEKGYETKHPGESGDCKCGQVNTKVGDMVVLCIVYMYIVYCVPGIRSVGYWVLGLFLYFILCLRSHIEVNAHHYEGGEVE